MKFYYVPLYEVKCKSREEVFKKVEQIGKVIVSKNFLNQYDAKKEVKKNIRQINSLGYVRDILTDALIDIESPICLRLPERKFDYLQFQNFEHYVIVCQEDLNEQNLVDPKDICDYVENYEVSKWKEIYEERKKMMEKIDDQTSLVKLIHNIRGIKK